MTLGVILKNPHGVVIAADTIQFHKGMPMIGSSAKKIKKFDDSNAVLVYNFSNINGASVTKRLFVEYQKSHESFAIESFEEFVVKHISDAGYGITPNLKLQEFAQNYVDNIRALANKNNYETEIVDLYRAIDRLYKEHYWHTHQRKFYTGISNSFDSHPTELRKLEKVLPNYFGQEFIDDIYKFAFSVIDDHIPEIKELIETNKHDDNLGIYEGTGSERLGKEMRKRISDGFVVSLLEEVIDPAHIVHINLMNNEFNITDTLYSGVIPGHLRKWQKRIPPNFSLSGEGVRIFLFAQQDEAMDYIKLQGTGYLDKIKSMNIEQLENESKSIVDYAIKEQNRKYGDMAGVGGSVEVIKLIV